MLIHTHFKALKALTASSGSDTHSDFLLAPSPERSLFSGCVNVCEALYEPLIVAHKAKEGLNFHVGFGQHTFCNGSQIQITRPHSCLRDLVHQVVDLFLERLYFNGLSFKLYSLNQSKTTCSLWRCSSTVCKKTIMLSR